MLRRAYAFTERYKVTAFTEEPVDYYVLRFPFLYYWLNSGDITTTNLKQFREILAEQRARGTNVILHRLPPFVKSIDEVAISEDAQLKASVRRRPWVK